MELLLVVHIHVARMGKAGALLINMSESGFATVVISKWNFEGGRRGKALSMTLVFGYAFARQYWRIALMELLVDIHVHEARLAKAGALLISVFESHVAIVVTTHRKVGGGFCGKALSVLMAIRHTCTRQYWGGVALMVQLLVLKIHC